MEATSSADAAASTAAYPKLIHFNEVVDGGHLAAWEQPEILSGELRSAFRSLR